MRSSLEKASWIAGIISAVIAIYAVLPPHKVENVEPSLDSIGTGTIREERLLLPPIEEYLETS
jgi:hypothetical protein